MTDDFRAAIRAELDRRGMSISALARAAGLTQPQLSTYLSGQRDLTGASLERIADALGLRWALTPRS